MKGGWELTCNHCGNVSLDTGSMNAKLYCTACHGLSYGQLRDRYLSADEIAAWVKPPNAMPTKGPRAYTVV